MPSMRRVICALMAVTTFVTVSTTVVTTNSVTDAIASQTSPQSTSNQSPTNDNGCSVAFRSAIRLAACSRVSVSKRWFLVLWSKTKRQCCSLTCEKSMRCSNLPVECGTYLRPRIFLLCERYLGAAAELSGPGTTMGPDGAVGVPASDMHWLTPLAMASRVAAGVSGGITVTGWPLNAFVALVSPLGVMLSSASWM